MTSGASSEPLASKSKSGRQEERTVKKSELKTRESIEQQIREARNLFASVTSNVNYESDLCIGSLCSTVETLLRALPVWVSVENGLPAENECVLWCRVPVEEPPVVGYLEDQELSEGYYTHWARLPNEFWPSQMLAAAQRRGDA